MAIFTIFFHIFETKLFINNVYNNENNYFCYSCMWKKTKTFPIIYDLHTAVWVKTYIFFECRQIYHSNSSYDNK